VAVFPSLWNRASSASQKEGVGVHRGIATLNGLCGDAELTAYNNL
jgi:hypothetical protein